MQLGAHTRGADRDGLVERLEDALDHAPHVVVGTGVLAHDEELVARETPGGVLRAHGGPQP
ncbi:hypothetical protein D3C85_1818490 [compost metagenome]